MIKLRYPAILTDLGHVGDHGLPLNHEPWFQHELELCREWGFQLRISEERVSLRFDQEQLIPYWIQKETPGIAWEWLRINGFLRLESTNSEATEMARQGAPTGTLIYAEEQTSGKGRNGHTWFSPPQTGLYFSLVIQPSQSTNFWPLLTYVASVALADTLKALSDNKIIPHSLDIDLKWPNDVLLSGKKCAGILLEMVSSGPDKHAAVVGIGVNVHKGSIPEFLASEATCLDAMASAFVPRRYLLVQFLQHFQQCYLMFEKGNHEELLERWKNMSSMWNETPIEITDGDMKKQVMTCGLDPMGALLVRTPEGKRETIFAGDIRVRKDLRSENS